LEPQIGEEQGGFRSTRGCDDQTLILNEVLQDSVHHKKPLYMAFVDLQKAYDRVWRLGLWYKLTQHNVPPKFVRILQELYSVVPNRVRVGNHLSREFNISIGLKQGCTLSPLLFDVFINDLIVELRQNHPHIQFEGVQGFNSLFFADDIAMLARNPSDLQAMVTTLETWCQKWQMEVNVSKTKVMIVGTKCRPAPFRYGGKDLEVVKSFKYLGVHFQDDGGWTTHMKYVLGKAQKATEGIGKLLSNQSLAQATRMWVWLTLVRPMIEYGMQVWTPTSSDFKKLERIQLKVAKTILGCCSHTPTPAVLGDLGLCSLVNRQKIVRLTAWEKVMRMQPHRLTQQVWRSKELKLHPNPRSWRLTIRPLVKTVSKRSHKSEKWPQIGCMLQNTKELRGMAKNYSTLRDYVNWIQYIHPMVYLTQGHNPRHGKVVFKMRSNTLPIAEVLARGREDATGICKCCDKGVIENLSHFLLECDGTKEARRRLVSSLPEKVGSQSLTVEDLLDQHLQHPGVLEGLYYLWKQRCEQLTQRKNQTAASNLITHWFPSVSKGKTDQPTNDDDDITLTNDIDDKSVSNDSDDKLGARDLRGSKKNRNTPVRIVQKGPGANESLTLEAT
jgi:hypothetical protein